MQKPKWANPGILPRGGDNQMRTQIERWLLARQKEPGAGFPDQIEWFRRFSTTRDPMLGSGSLDL